MARAKVTVKVDIIEAKAMARAVDTAFADLVANVPALRQTDNHNATIKARESLKAALVAKPNPTDTTKKEA